VRVVPLFGSGVYGKSAVVTRHTTDQIDWLIETARRYGVSVNFQIPPG